ncbi:MAG: ATP-grasp domain-containing protein, partial [Pseudomonadota bacterium]
RVQLEKGHGRFRVGVDQELGAAEAITVAPDPDLQDYTERLVRHLGYHGFGCAQFLVDPDAESPVSFLELNPRLGAAFAVTLASGIDLPAAALRLTEGGRTAVEPYAAGRRMAWVYGDLLGLVRALQCREIGARDTALWLGRCARSLWRADIHATWDWTDPLPSLALATQWIPRRLKRWSGTEQQSQV